MTIYEDVELNVHSSVATTQDVEVLAKRQSDTDAVQSEIDEELAQSDNDVGDMERRLEERLTKLEGLSQDVTEQLEMVDRFILAISESNSFVRDEHSHKLLELEHRLTSGECRIRTYGEQLDAVQARQIQLQKEHGDSLSSQTATREALEDLSNRFEQATEERRSFEQQLQQASRFMSNFSNCISDMLGRSELKTSTTHPETHYNPGALDNLADKLANEKRSSICSGVAQMREKLEKFEKEGTARMDWHGGRYPRPCKLMDSSTRRCRQASVRSEVVPGRKKRSPCPSPPTVYGVTLR